ncbi:MAG: hypothetical protein ABW166_07845 [Sedimenticola sp.]
MRIYINQPEDQVRRRQETLERWEAYQQSGESVAHEEMADWLGSWGDDEKIVCPTIK